MRNIVQTLDNYPEIANMLYRDFQARINEGERIDIERKLLLDVKNLADKKLFRTFKRFNDSILKTNFHKDKVGAIGFRLDPQVFMNLLKVNEIPFGIFHVIGRDFNGFHIRFRDISRGGVRMIMYNNEEHNKIRMT